MKEFFFQNSGKNLKNNETYHVNDFLHFSCPVEREGAFQPRKPIILYTPTEVEVSA